MTDSNRFTIEGPRESERRIIGVELAVTGLDGVERELEMFACQHTLPAVETAYWGRPQMNVRVTLHTSQGDVTLRGLL